MYANYVLFQFLVIKSCQDRRSLQSRLGLHTHFQCYRPIFTMICIINHFRCKHRNSVYDNYDNTSYRHNINLCQIVLGKHK